MARRRLDLKEAAEALGTSVDAVRKRISRGTLESDKDPDGRVYVWLDLDQTVSPGDSSLALLEAKDETIQLLRRELEVWQEEARRKDHIIAALTERIPELEPPRETSPEARESHETAAESPTTSREEWPLGHEGETYGTSAQEAEESLHGRRERSWWRAFFGLE